MSWVSLRKIVSLAIFLLSVVKPNNKNLMNWEKLGLNQYPLDHWVATHRLSLAWQQLNVCLS